MSTDKVRPSIYLYPFVRTAMDHGGFFKQVGNGAVQRKSQSKLVETMSVKDFGALGGGSGDTVAEWLAGGAHDRGCADLAAIQVNYPHVTALTDTIDWAAIQAACDDVFNNSATVGRRRTVHVPYGDYMCNKQIVTGHFVQLFGDGTKSTRIFLTAELGADVPFIRLSRGELQFQHLNSLRRLDIRCQGLADTGVWGDDINEYGGIYEVDILGWRKIGLHLAGGKAQNATFRDVGVSTTEATVEDAIGIFVESANHPMFIENGSIGITKAGGGIGVDSVGILNRSGSFCTLWISNTHFENLKDAIRSDGFGQTMVRNCDGHSTVDHVCHWTGNSGGDGEILGVGKSGGFAFKDTTNAGGYVATVVTGTAVSGGASTIELEAGQGASVEVGMKIRLTAGTGSGQNRVVLSKATDVITVHKAWDTPPDATTTYVVDSHGLRYLSGQGKHLQKYTAAGRKGGGGARRDRTTLNLSGETINIPHGFPVTPRWFQVTTFGSTRLFVHVVDVDDTNLIVKLWNDETGAYLSSGAFQFSWEAEL